LIVKHRKRELFLWGQPDIKTHTKKNEIFEAEVAGKEGLKLELRNVKKMVAIRDLREEKKLWRENFWSRGSLTSFQGSFKERNKCSWELFLI